MRYWSFATEFEGPKATRSDFFVKLRYADIGQLAGLRDRVI
jgi:hypothetical protein